MPKRRTPPRKRAIRRSPDARALEWATVKLERAERQRDACTDKLRVLSAEIPRLRLIIAALSPAPTFTGSDLKHLKESVPMPNLLNPPNGKSQIVAGMDVSRFLNPRAPVVADPVAPDMLDEDAALDVVDNLLEGKHD